ncbi:MAG: adenosylcobinamide-GDP ribazoletransferase [bacterium]|nr:adenosylcobinamide-GDP ribazoletransferase [bacterium]
MRGLLIAAQFLTRLPLPVRTVWDEQGLRLALPFFPVVGAFTGMLASLPYLLSRWWPDQTVAAASVTLLILLTGGLHLDGLGDCCDGLLSGRPADRAREIMKEGSIGPFGVIGITLVILMKVAMLGSIGPEKTLPALIAATALGRWGSLLALHLYPACGGGLGEMFKKSLALPGLCLATAMTAAILLAGGPVRLLLLPATVLIILPPAAAMVRVLGGLNGDCHGALIELGELVVLIVLSFV